MRPPFAPFLQARRSSYIWYTYDDDYDDDDDDMKHMLPAWMLADVCILIGNNLLILICCFHRFYSLQFNSYQISNNIIVRCIRGHSNRNKFIVYQWLF